MSLISEKQVQQFRDEGYFLTDVMWDKPVLDEIAAEFDRLHAETIKTAETGGNKTQIELARHRPFIGQVHMVSPPCERFIRSPIYLEACARFIGPSADLYYNQAVIKPPEKGGSFAWHQDSGYQETKPLQYITCWTAISRTFVGNGCIWIIPGSHQRGLIKHAWDEKDSAKKPALENEDGAIPVEMKAGQVAIFTSLLLHKSGANTSNEIRRGYVPQYHHPDAINAQSGKRWGDLYPVLREGKPVQPPLKPGYYAQN